MRRLAGGIIVITVALLALSSAGARPLGTGDQGGGAEFEEGTILIGFEPGTSPAEERAIEASVGAARVKTVGDRTRVLKVRKGKVLASIAALKRHGKVRYAEPNYVVHALTTPNDPSFPQLWGLANSGQSVQGSSGTSGADVELEPAWTVTTGTSGVVIGVVDTGIDYNHSDLVGNVWSSPGVNGCGGGTHGYNAITNSCNPMDDNNHGTHVSGTIGAQGNNAVGVAGVNWTTTIMGLKFLNAQGSGLTSDAIEAINWAISAKQAGVNVRVLNNSWAGGGFSQALLDAINAAGASDILFVVAAGNNGSSNDTTSSYPCNYNAANIICVAATTQTDGLASFSNYGANTVDLGAPGTNILSTVRGGYSYYDGTSMATPHVAGAAALVLATGYQSVGALRATILGAVDAVPELSGRVGTGGRLNVCKAIPGCSPSPPPPPPPAPPPPPPAPTVKQYQPTGYTILSGRIYLGRGALSRLYNDDGSRLEISGVNVGGSYVSDLAVATSITSGELATLTKLTVSYNGNASVGSTSVTLYVCNSYSGGSCASWQTVNGPVTGATSDRSVTWSDSASPKSYVSNAGEIRFRIRGTRSSSFRTRTDRVRFTIEY